MNKRLLSVAALGVLFSASTCALGRPDDAAATYKLLADKVGPALVTVKFIMKIEGPEAERFGEGGREIETSGVAVDPGGLILVSNAKMGGLASRMGMNANPTDIKVLIGDDTEGFKSRILARDSDIDLCWIQIDDDRAKGKPISAIDLASSATPQVGDRLYLVDRMSKFFDHAVVVDEGRMAGSTRKPRKLYIPTDLSGSQGNRSGDGALGMPMFTADGKLVGVNVIQLPGKEDTEGGDTGAGGNIAVLLLPAEDVAKATKRAKETPAPDSAADAAAPPTADADKKREEKK